MFFITTTLPFNSHIINIQETSESLSIFIKLEDDNSAEISIIGEIYISNRIFQ